MIITQVRNIPLKVAYGLKGYIYYVVTFIHEMSLFTDACGTKLFMMSGSVMRNSCVQ